MSDLSEAIAMHEKQLAVQRESEGIQTLLQHSQAHVDSGTTRTNEDGTTSSLISTIISDERLNQGRETVIPLFWNGKERSHKDAIEFALQSGKTWPSAITVDEAQFIDDVAHVTLRKQVPGEDNAERKDFIP